MPITPNYDALWDTIQHREDVTFQKVQPDGTATSYGGIQALGRAIRQSVSDVGGTQMTPAKATWHLRASSLPPDVTPDRGDRVVSAAGGRMAGTWVILSADILTAGTRYECQTQRLLDP